MPKFSLRFKKYQAGPALSGILNHCSRRKRPKNADPARAHLNCLDGSFRTEDFLTSRKNGVALVEIVVSASREWYGFSDGAGGWKAFMADARKHFEEMFGGSVTAVAEHHDEITPHAHFLISPFAVGTTARAIIGGHRYRMGQIQNDFERKVGSLHGLHYTKGSTASHTELREFYKTMDAGFPGDGWRTVSKNTFDHLSELAALGKSASVAMAERLRQVDRRSLRTALGIPLAHDQIGIVEAIRYLAPGIGRAGAINRAWMAAAQLGLLDPPCDDSDESDAERYGLR